VASAKAKRDAQEREKEQIRAKLKALRAEMYERKALATDDE
jgi:hypothetical protein